jgi:hypothetical protein
MVTHTNAQDDTGESIRLFSHNELIEQYGGINEAVIGGMVVSWPQASKKNYK